MNNSQLRF